MKFKQIKEEDKMVIGFIISIVLIVTSYLIWGLIYPIY